MSEHPSAITLDTWYAERNDAAVEAHLEGCTECREYVQGLEESTADFLADESAEAFLHRPAIAAELARPAPKAESKTRWWQVLVPALAAVAALIVILPTGTRPTPDPTDSIRLKGGLQLEAVRLRAGEQTTHGAELGLRPKDELRFRFTLAEPTALTIGVLEEDGTWTALATAKSFPAGQHAVPQRSLEVDDQPTTGWVLAGPPDAVDRARATRDFGDLTAIRLLDASIH